MAAASPHPESGSQGGGSRNLKQTAQKVKQGLEAALKSLRVSGVIELGNELKEINDAELPGVCRDLGFSETECALVMAIARVVTSDGESNHSAPSESRAKQMRELARNIADIELLRQWFASSSLGANKKKTAYAHIDTLKALLLTVRESLTKTGQAKSSLISFAMARCYPSQR